MRILSNILYFFLFLILAVAAMFVGGVAGVSGSFFVMVSKGDMQNNLLIAILSLVLILFVVNMLRRHNKKVIKRKKRLALEAENGE